ncbi:hypothetical protein B0H19DRAFT_1080288 [Mycena capillaripes]|nr:hypothetical protein B0H19DRAFT_1080288 [Mycena capillaripes]
MYATNHELFGVADGIPHMDNWNSTGDIMFSTEYRHFIQALKNATDSASTPEQLKELNDLSTNRTTACITEVGAIQNEAYTAYKKMGGTGNLTDDVFTEFASQMFGNYSLSIDACHNAENAYDNAVAKLQGLDHGEIEAEILAMGPLITPDGSLIPGINMATSQPIPGTIKGQFKAATVAFYAMPSLNTTLTDWQTTPDDQPPTMNWTSSIDSRISTASDESSSGSVRIFLSKASASQNSNMRMELIDVERGAWFDDFATATAVANPSSNDPSGAKYKAAFDESFGTAANPGPASTYNDKALVVYRPKAIFKYGSQDEFNKAQSAQGSGTANFGLWGGSASGKEDSSGIVANNATWELSFTPNTRSAYIVGFIMKSFWDDATNSTLIH